MMRLFLRKTVFTLRSYYVLWYVSAPKVACAIQLVQRLKCSMQLSKFIINPYIRQYYKVVIYMSSVLVNLRNGIHLFID